jgi:glutathione S-transferase
MRRMIAKRFWHQGVGRFSEAELAVLGARDIEILAEAIGDRPYLMGETPCAADAAVFANLALLMDEASVSPTRDAALAKRNLVAYRDRMFQRFFDKSVCKRDRTAAYRIAYGVG